MQKQQKVIQKTKKSDLEGTFAVQTVLQLAAGKCERPKASRSQPTPPDDPIAGGRTPGCVRRRSSTS